MPVGRAPSSTSSDQVVVRRHQAEAEARPLEMFESFASELAQEGHSIEVIAEERRRGPDAVGEDVECPRFDVARRPWHRAKMVLHSPLRKCPFGSYDTSVTVPATGRVAPSQRSPLGSAPDGSDRRRGSPQRHRRGSAPRARGRRAGRRRHRRGGRRSPHLLPALVVEADPGAAARAGARGPRRARPRDRIRVAPGDAGPDRRRPRPARQGAGDRGRPRARPAGGQASGEGLPQLLGQARRHARPLPRTRLADRAATACPTIRCSGPAPPRTPRQPRRRRTSSRPRPTAAASSPSRSRSSAWPTPSPASSSYPKERESLTAMRTHPDLVGGPDGVDCHLMRTATGWFAKGGAEGLFCAGGPDAIGVALKVRGRSHAAARPGARTVPPPARRRPSRARHCPYHKQSRRARRRARSCDFVTHEVFFTNL